MKVILKWASVIKCLMHVVSHILVEQAGSWRTPVPQDVSENGSVHSGCTRKVGFSLTVVFLVSVKEKQEVNLELD